MVEVLAELPAPSHSSIATDANNARRFGSMMLSFFFDIVVVGPSIVISAAALSIRKEDP